MLGATTFIIAISRRAAYNKTHHSYTCFLGAAITTLFPTVSIMWAAFSTSSLAWSISILLLAREAKMASFWARGFPNATLSWTCKWASEYGRERDPSCLVPWISWALELSQPFLSASYSDGYDQGPIYPVTDRQTNMKMTTFDITVYLLAWAISKPRPSPSSMLSVGTRTLSKTISAWQPTGWGAWLWAK